MVKQTKDYIQKKKKKHLIHTAIWGSVVAVIFIIGCIVMEKRANEFTLIAALFILPFALHLTRYFAYAKYKDPSPKHASILEHMKGSYALYHSAIVPDSTANLYFEHIIVTSRNVYFISKSEEMIAKAKPVLNTRLTQKGIAQSAQKYIYANDKTAVKNASLKIQKDACFSDEQMGNNTKIIDAIMM